jgi:hypothetical protein
MGIQDETLDKKVARYLDRDDMIWTTMSTFSSATVHCARCHNHKFDPIPTADYYALQAVFAGVDRVDRPYDPDPKVHATRRELQARKADLEGSDYPVAMLLDPAVQAGVAEWEAGLGQSHARWTVLDPLQYASSGGATLTKQADGSVLAGGTRPEKDTYTITAHTDVRGITAVRLEVLTDDSLPQKGPGRAENGNLHLSEFTLAAGAIEGAAKFEPAQLQNPTADFDQQDWPIAKALDGNADTAWGIHPQEGTPHAAVFELKQPLGHKGGWCSRWSSTMVAAT